MKRLTAYSARDLFPGGVFYLSIVVLIISFGLFILFRSVWDYDFWWHIATGRYIVATGHLPHSDPFSFTSLLPENSNLAPLREKFILTQYWLAQVVMYFLYHVFGPAGIGVLRALLLVGAIAIIYKALKDRGTEPYIIFLSISLAAFSLFRFFGDRPVLFTISFSVICFVMLDEYVRKRSRMVYFLPLLMLVWANLHGGFILGDAMILIFMGVEGAKLILGRSVFSKKEKIVFFSVLTIAIAVSGINPNGFFALLIAFSHKYLPFYAGIEEYQSPLVKYTMQYASPDYSYLAALFLFPVILVLRNKKFNATHFILLASLLVESLSAVRFTVYYVMIAALVLGNELDLWLKEHREKFVVKQAHLNIAISIIMAASSVLYLLGITSDLRMKDISALRVNVSAWTVPQGTADFLKKNHIRGNIFNDMATGGYLAWKLYPEVKTFIDTRSLNYTVMREYSWISTARNSVNGHLPPGKIPLWKRLLDHYKINLLIFNPFNIYGNILPLTDKILDDPDWVPVSLELPAVVFARNVPENRDLIEKFKKTHRQVYDMMITRASMAAKVYAKNPRYLESIGDIFMRMGRKGEAMTAYRYALKKMPDDRSVKAKLDKLEKERPEERK